MIESVWKKKLIILEKCKSYFKKRNLVLNKVTELMFTLNFYLAEEKIAQLVAKEEMVVDQIIMKLLIEKREKDMMKMLMLC